MLHVTLAASLLAALLTPVSVTGTDRVSETGGFGPEQTKSVTVACPDDSAPYAGGGAVRYGLGPAGGVALTGIVPDQDRRTVTVTATAPAGRSGVWALTAYAVCGSSHGLIPVVVTGTGSAVAECPPDRYLYGLGFRTAGAQIISADIVDYGHSVRVTAAGANQVVAIALCGAGYWSLQKEATNAGPGWPKIATVRERTPDLTAFAVGATVIGPPTAALDAIVPGPDDGTAWARGTLLDLSAERAAATDSNGSVTVEETAIGTSY